MTLQGWILTIAVLGLSGLVLWASQAVLMPFVAGLVLAYLLSPLVNTLVARKMPRSLAASVPVAVALVLLGVLLALGLPLLVDQLTNFLQKLPGYFNALQQSVIPPKLARLMHLRSVNADVMMRSLGLVSAGGAGWMLENVSRLYTGAVAAFNIGLLIIMTPLVAFYLLFDWPELFPRVLQVLPRRWRAPAKEMVHEIDTKMAAYLRGQLGVCAALAVYYGIALELAGMELGWVVGIAAGLLAFIPVVGALTALALMLMMMLVQYQMIGWEPYAFVLAIYAVGQLLETSILVPALVGRQVGLHPIWVVFALLVGGELGGVPGMLLSIPGAVIVSVVTPRIIRVWHTMTD